MNTVRDAELAVRAGILTESTAQDIVARIETLQAIDENTATLDQRGELLGLTLMLAAAAQAATYRDRQGLTLELPSAGAPRDESPAVSVDSDVDDNPLAARFGEVGRRHR